MTSIYMPKGLTLCFLTKQSHRWDKAAAAAMASAVVRGARAGG